VAEEEAHADFRTMTGLFATIIVLLFMTMLPQTALGTKFSDGQILKRVEDHLGNFMNTPVKTIGRVQKFLETGGFPGLSAADRGILSKWLWMELSTYVYFGLEDGTFLLYTVPGKFSPPRPGMHYREPGFSGYEIDDVDSRKHWQSCIDDSGAVTNCTLPEGSSYVRCIDDCKLEKCNGAGEGPQPECSLMSLSEEITACEESTKWCSQYMIDTVPEGETRGAIPSVYSCVNSLGDPEQRPGLVLTGPSYEEPGLGDCYHMDEVTLVNSTLKADYTYCGEGEECNPFLGAFSTREYDPRYRPWYIGSKEQQRPLWSDPYPFFRGGSVGITYTEPIYVRDEDNRQVFSGVFAVDYTLGDIREFLTQYQGSDFMVLVVEAAEPNYVVASSSGSLATKLVRKENLTVPCEDGIDATACTVVRVPIDELDGNPADRILRKAFEAQTEADFPSSDLVAFKLSQTVRDDAYISQGGVFEQPNAYLTWRIIVVTPMEQSSIDAAYVGTGPFYIILTVALVGFAFCISLFTSFFGFRKQRAVQNADWRFTCAFLFGCSMLNLSSLTLVGENRDELCMLRMWTFNLLFATALSPLFVKVGRMYRLLHASQHFRRVNVTNLQAMLYTLPIIVAELVILTVFSFADPSKAVEELGSDPLEFGQIQQVTCQHESQAFLWTQVAFDAFLVLIGCYLAFETRNLDARFGEAKQLAFAMYNIAFTGIVVLLITRLVEMDGTIKLLLQAFSVAWGTMFSSAAFVVPRLMDVQRHLRKLKRSMFVHSSRKLIIRDNFEVLVDSDSAAFSSAPFSRFSLDVSANGSNYDTSGKGMLTTADLSGVSGMSSCNPDRESKQDSQEFVEQGESNQSGGGGSDSQESSDHENKKPASNETAQESFDGNNSLHVTWKDD